MRVRVLHAKICIIAYALPGLTARQLLNSSTLLDSSTARQSSTELDRPRHPGACSQPRLASTGSTATRQLLDSYSTGSTGKALTGPRQRPRQRLDGASTARQLDSQGSTPALLANSKFPDSKFRFRPPARIGNLGISSYLQGALGAGIGIGNLGISSLQKSAGGVGGRNWNWESGNFELARS